MDPVTRTTSLYLDFNGRGTRPGFFDKLTTEAGLASGFISFEFDPDYAHNGRFYTIHLEETALPGTLVPDNQAFLGLDVAGYTATAPVPHLVAPITKAYDRMDGREHRQPVVRGPGARTAAHSPQQPDPSARRSLLQSSGASRRSGLAGDVRRLRRRRGRRFARRLPSQRPAARHAGRKILRIVPDLETRAGDTAVAANGRYRVPSDNPFASVAGARPEIWAFQAFETRIASAGISREASYLIASMIGWRTWETVLLVHKGGNYGFPLREGGESVEGDRTTPLLPQSDTLPVLVSDAITAGTATPLYPVLRYGHGADGGDAIAGGFAYSGKRIPQLSGKFVLGDTSTGRLWWADFKDMRWADAASRTPWLHCTNCRSGGTTLATRRTAARRYIRR